MSYDPQKHHRRSIRLQAYDYAQSGAYFVTVCVQDHVCLFGKVVEGRMYLNTRGQLVAEEWQRTATLRPQVELDAFVVMPNHVHGIVLIVPPEAEDFPTPHGYNIRMGGRGRRGDARVAPTQEGKRPRGPRPNSLGAVVGAFKSAVTRRINRQRDTPGAKVWQRNYYDRILRNEKAWRACRRYIEKNPSRWDSDLYHPHHSS